VIDPRLYRAAFLPALLALIVVAFSLEDRPAALPQALAADVLFQGRAAAASAEQIASDRPDRRPGTLGDRSVARRVAHSFSRSGFTTVVDPFSGDDGQRLLNVIGRRAGATRRQIVVVAARDAGSVPDATTSAADTAALMRVGRALQGTPSRKTIVLASVDGSTLGELGIHRLLAKLPDRDLVEAVLVVSNLAAPGPRTPPLIAWSNGAQRAGVALERTAAASEGQEFGRVPAGSGIAAQLIRLAFPLGVGGQGPLLEGGADAVRFSASGELPPRKGARGSSSIDVHRLGPLGRAVLRTVFAIDQSGRRIERSPRSYLTVAHKLVPGWSLALLGMSLILPALVASIDGFARARRRRQPVGRFGRWLVASSLAPVVGLVLAKLSVVVGIVPDPPRSPVAPELRPVHAGDVALLGVLGGVVVLAWILAQWLTRRERRGRLDVAEPGAGAVLALALSLLTFAIWFVNPYAALVLLPALHLWLIASIGRLPDRAPGLVFLVAAPLLPLAAVALFYMARLSLNPVEGLWYLFLLVTSGDIGIFTSLFACVFLALLACLVSTLVARARKPPPVVPEEPKRPTVFGPGGYAGPGALGGTESALRR
jgi:hypothetical protein